MSVAANERAESFLTAFPRKIAHAENKLAPIPKPSIINSALNATDEFFVAQIPRSFADVAQFLAPHEHTLAADERKMFNYAAPFSYVEIIGAVTEHKIADDETTLIITEQLNVARPQTFASNPG